MSNLATLVSNDGFNSIQATTYTESKLLAASVPESFTVPSDDQALPAGYVRFGSPVATDFYARAFTTQESTNRVTNGTFAEYVTNGAFATDTGWTKGTGWTIGSGVADATGAISTALSQTLAITLIEGYAYTITFTVATVSAGTITPSIGGTAGTTRSTAATFTESIVAGTTQLLEFDTAGFTGTIDNVTVTAWVLGTGWTTDGATAIATGAISTALSQTAYWEYPLVEGQAYLVTFTATRSAGSTTISVGGTAGSARSTAATFAEVIIAGSTQAISFATTGFTGTIDDVTIVACASVPIDAATGLSSVMNPEGFRLDKNASIVSIVSAGTPVITASFYKR